MLVYTYVEAIPFCVLQILLSKDFELEFISYASLACKAVSLVSQMITNLYRLKQGYYDFSDPFQVFNMFVFTAIPVILFLFSDLWVILTLGMTFVFESKDNICTLRHKLT